MLGFCLAKLPSLDVANQWSKAAAPGQWYWFQHGIYRIGITLHLLTVIPAGILMVWQFVPAIRHRAILFHRINGYSVIVLLLLSNTGALMIVRRAFGGDLSTQGAVGVLVIATTAGLFMAYYNIKKLQIEQHRAWMLRTMLYFGTIITTRLIMIISAQILSKIGSYYVTTTCGELLSMRSADYVGTKYPACLGANATTLEEQLVPVLVFFGSNIEEIGASLKAPFGMSLWIAIFLHGVGVEIYLALTPREAQRLRQVSYERQLEAGYPNPGSAGLVIENFGDADQWCAANVRQKEQPDVSINE